GLQVPDNVVLENAEHVGARYYTLQGNLIDEDDDAIEQALLLIKIKTRVQRYLAQERMTIALSDVTVDQNYTYPVNVSPVTASKVTVSYSRSMMLPQSWVWPFGPVTLTGQAVFRNLY